MATNPPPTPSRSLDEGLQRLAADASKPLDAASLHAAIAIEGRRRVRRRVGAGIASAAAILLLLVAGLYLQPSGPSEPPPPRTAPAPAPVAEQPEPEPPDPIAADDDNGDRDNAAAATDDDAVVEVHLPAPIPRGTPAREVCRRIAEVLAAADASGARIERRPNRSLVLSITARPSDKPRQHLVAELAALLADHNTINLTFDGETVTGLVANLSPAP